ncbi:VWA domain-containing protein [Bacillus sp. NP157]|nr:VWA domain-containing protein [Bacillus sp. NP157]
MSEATTTPPPLPTPGERLAAWRTAWPAALACWSRFTRLRDPRLCDTRVEAAQEGLSGSFAMIRLFDQSVVIDMETVARFGLDDLAVEVLAHEIGHHVLAPATASDQFRLLARMRRALPTLERHAPMVANLYTDLFINDRLQRRAGLRMDEVYRRLARATPASPDNRLWMLYMGIYEELWSLPRGSLGGAVDDVRIRGDAWLGARLIRVYSGEWLHAAGRFATLLLEYLVEDTHGSDALGYLHDTRMAAEHCEPSGLVDVESDELDGGIHPSEDPGLSGERTAPVEPATSNERSTGQAREPFEYGEILKAAGVTRSEHDIAVRYYRERALPDLVPFPTRRAPESPEPLPEGLETWEVGDAVEDIDWFQSVLVSPRIIPGVTTVRRTMGVSPGREQDVIPVDLDIYVDSSGSMPNPQQHTSYLALAGAIIALSALRTGSRVQATLWSGKQQYMHTEGFVRDEDAILRVLTGYYGGATAFPIHRLRETFAARRPHDRPVHILMISDAGIDTMFARDEQGLSGWDISAHALAVGRAGGTMALNIPANWTSGQWFGDLRRARDEQGWAIHPCATMEDLVAFARAFSDQHYRNREAA